MYGSPGMDTSSIDRATEVAFSKKILCIVGCVLEQEEQVFPYPAHPVARENIASGANIIVPPLLND